MLNWLKEKFAGGAAPDLGNMRAEDAERLVALLEIALPGLPKFQRDALSFITTGQPESVLGELKYNLVPQDDVAKMPPLMNKSPARDFMAKFQTDDPALLYRLGELLRRLQWQRHLSANLPEPPDRQFRWISALLRSADLLAQRTDGDMGRHDVPFTFTLEFLRDTAQQFGTPPDVFSRYLIGASSIAYQHNQTSLPFSRFTDWADFLNLNRMVVADLVKGTGMGYQMGMIGLLAEEPAFLTEFFPELVIAALSDSRPAQEKAGSVLRKSPDLARPRLEEALLDSSLEVRIRAFDLSRKMFPTDPALAEFLKGRLEWEKSAKLKDAFRRYIKLLESEPAQLSAGGYDAEAAWQAILVEPLPPLEIKPLPESALTLLTETLEKCDQEAAEYFEKNKDQKYGRKEPFAKIAHRAKDIFEIIQKPDMVKDWPIKEVKESGPKPSLVKFCHHPDLQLWHIFQFAAVFNPSLETYSVIHGADYLVRAYLEKHEPLSLRQTAQHLEVIRRDPASLGKEYLERSPYWTMSVFENLPEEPWKYYTRYPQSLSEVLGLHEIGVQTYLDYDKRRNVFEVLSALPALPPELEPYLWDLALGSSKKERHLAQAALHSVPNKEPRIIEALTDAKQEIRASAALWLAQMGAKDAIEPIKAALAKEKNDVAKGAMFDALDRLGVPIEQFLDRGKLEAEARKAMAKGLPKEVDWLSPTAFPAVRWADNGQPVPSVILQYFIAQAVKLKSAEPPALIRKYCGFLDPADRAQLGKYLLLAFLAKDTAPRYTADEAAAEAQKQLDQQKQYVAKYPQYYQNWDEQGTYKALYNNLLTQCMGSAIAAKGLLGFCACCCTGDISATVYAYIKKWFGQRLHQCKALIVMLAQIPDRSAIQVLLTVGNRFRTKGIQEEARNQAQLLAEREGWTMDELADRTIPTGGFDETGRQELDYGTRQFVATLLDDFTIELMSPAGKAIKSLPDANQTDDAELAKAAKKAFSDAKKELKEVLKLQKERLYEALCTQRPWKFEDWDAYLNRHPIVGLYCQKLVWRVVTDPHDPAAPTFRPLPDRSLTDYQDEAVEIAPDALVTLAHQSLVTDEIAKGWQAHFKDYDIKPLLVQFGREAFEPTEEQVKAKNIATYEGYMMDAFTFRGAATKLGYVRGAAEDGGFFYEYTKEFPASRIRSVLRFTGNVLPEENVRCALTTLHFERMPAPGAPDTARWNARELPLAEVPAVLLSECWNDYKQVAAAGPGYDADWKKKAEWGG